MNFNKLIINVALTGIVPTKKENPWLPTTPEEIATDAKKVYDLGASIVHIHARDENGLPSCKKEIYREIIERVREKCDSVLITVSTSGRRSRDLKERMEVLELEGAYKPDMASITLGSLNFMEDYAINAPQAILSLLDAMDSCNIRPEIEIFDTGMANFAKYLHKKGHLKGALYSNLILGSLGTMPATPRNLCHLIDELPVNLVWGVTGVGRFAFGMQSLSIAMGGHVRVGLEDSIYMDEEKMEPATNEKLVLRAVKVAEAVGRDTATPGEVRTLLGL
jgi:3-keto-5-aminohexanoate cleavage enzyme